jgi:hypothetical protein
VFLDVQGERKDVVFLSTEHYMFCVLAWDADKGTPLRTGTKDCRYSHVDLQCLLAVGWQGPCVTNPCSEHLSGSLQVSWSPLRPGM